ncbi:hypothetical protein BTN49_0396 [Candidatus Enterovibrio escicola]|uniref:Uncharacterized protein n=1 Tax=Candidatus Enterovibrio escicola TaxID=1927127 RepID=A0A2A5T5K6_9GAMM|nr:hypothetical protein [Candidatus Enterovibrio escacola]PCS23432.1 hypothetical protein BTN49_0396 [Candidatus Enterovibrio escacola]
MHWHKRLTVSRLPLAVMGLMAEIAWVALTRVIGIFPMDGNM